MIRRTGRIFKPSTLLVLVMVCILFYIYWIRFYYRLFDIPVYTDVKSGENLILNPNFEDKAFYSARYWKTSDGVLFKDSAGVYNSRAPLLLPGYAEVGYLSQKIVGDFKKGIYRFRGEGKDSLLIKYLKVSLKLRKGFFRVLELSGSPGKISRKDGWNNFEFEFKIPDNYTRIRIQLNYTGEDTLVVDNLLLNYLGGQTP